MNKLLAAITIASGLVLGACGASTTQQAGLTSPAHAMTPCKPTTLGDGTKTMAYVVREIDGFRLVKC